MASHREAQELATWLLEANPEKRLAYLLQKYGKQLGAYYEEIGKDVAGSERANTAANEFLTNLVYKVDPTQGDYSEWILRNWFKMSTGEKSRWVEDSSKVHDDLELFHKFKAKLPAEERDINKYSFRLLYARAQHALKDLAKVDVTNRANDAKASEITTVLNNSAWMVLIPKTEEASCKYGAGTRWCTASERNNYFEQYSRDGPLFIIIQKRLNSSPEEKWQLHLESGQFMDSADEAMDAESFFAQHPEPGAAIGAWMKANLAPDKFAEHIATVDPSVVIETLATGTPEQAKPLLYKTSIPLLITAIQSKKLTPERINPLMPKLSCEFLNVALKVGMGDGDIEDCYDKNSRSMAEAVFSGGGAFEDWHFESRLTYSEAMRYPSTYRISDEQQAVIKRIVLDQFSDATEEDWEDYADECSDVTDALQIADQDAQRHGAESHAYKTVMSAFEDEVGKLENSGTVNGVQVGWAVTIPYKTMLELCNTAREDDGSRVTPTYLRINHLVSIKIDEPYQGYSGFNEESFSEGLTNALSDADPGEPDPAKMAAREPAMAESAAKLIEKALRQ